MYVQKIKKLYNTVQVKKDPTQSNLFLETRLPVEFGCFGKPFNKEIEKYSTVNLLLNSPEVFYHLLNLTENDFYEKLHDVLDVKLDSQQSSNGYFNILE